MRAMQFETPHVTVCACVTTDAIHSIVHLKIMLIILQLNISAAIRYGRKETSDLTFSIISPLLNCRLKKQLRIHEANDKKKNLTNLIKIKQFL